MIRLLTLLARYFRDRSIERLFVPAIVTGMILLVLPSCAAWAQSSQISGLIKDPQGAPLTSAVITVADLATGVARKVNSNSSGLYVAPFLNPGLYRIAVQASGFKTAVQPEVRLETGQLAHLDFSLEIGTIQQSIEVREDSSALQVESAAVSTVIDHGFTSNLPLNGRSFNNLFLLVPGVQATSSGYSVNGQRTEGNQYFVDGVSANVGVYGSATFAATAGGGGNLASTNAAGGTNSLLSVDALQEFQIQTSSYAPEYGRTPGGQVQISSRAGSNAFHGTASDYFRNSVLDANNWFNNQLGIARQRENQHDFGGTIGGPILRNRTFFFFSYEGLRLLTPLTLISPVPSLSLRQDAPPAVQTILNLFPRPNGPDLTASGGICTSVCTPSGMAQYAASQRTRYNSDAESIRLDHRFSEAVSVFGRYNHSPSTALSSNGIPLLNLGYSLDTATVGSTWIVSPSMTNDLRVNWTETSILVIQQDPEVDGAVVPAFTSLLPGRNPETSTFNVNLLFGGGPYVVIGKNNDNYQKQWNVVDDFSLVRGSHQLKLGFDYRRLNPGHGGPNTYRQQLLFNSAADVLANNINSARITSGSNFSMVFPAYASFAQDTWRLRSNLTLTYGLRWDVAPAPSLENAVVHPVTQVSNLVTTAPRAAGSALYQTSFGNVSPRIGLAYSLGSNGFTTVFRAGFGTFYDIQNSLGGYFASGASGIKIYSNVPFPLTTAQAAAPPIVLANPPYTNVDVIDPNLRTPLTYQWNAAVEQQLGRGQSITAGYVGSAGHRLLRGITTVVPANNAYFKGTIGIGTSEGFSNYQALQLQLKRRLSRGLQIISSYAWSHSIDNSSAYDYGADYYSAPIADYNARLDKGSSDFDVRHTFNLGAHYNVPGTSFSNWWTQALRNWSIDPLLRIQSGMPVDSVIYTSIDGYPIGLRPDLVSGVPAYLYSSNDPGGRQINPAAVSDFTTGITSFDQLRQGTLGRNAFRGFGLVQTDLSVARTFPIRERIGVQFRADFFNILNHANCALPNGELGPYYGLSQSTYNASNVRWGGAAIPLYQIGGPRSVQLSLKIVF